MNFSIIENTSGNKIMDSSNINKSMKQPDFSSNEQVFNKKNEIIYLNSIKIINLKDDNSSESIQEITKKGINNNESNIIRNNINVKSNEIDTSGK